MSLSQSSDDRCAVLVCLVDTHTLCEARGISRGLPEPVACYSNYSSPIIYQSLERAASFSRGPLFESTVPPLILKPFLQLFFSLPLQSPLPPDSKVRCSLLYISVSLRSCSERIRFIGAWLSFSYIDLAVVAHELKCIDVTPYKPMAMYRFTGPSIDTPE